MRISMTYSILAQGTSIGIGVVYRPISKKFILKEKLLGTIDTLQNSFTRMTK